MSKYLFILLLALLLPGCDNDDARRPLPLGKDLPLIQPYQLGTGLTEIILTDFFPETKLIDSVLINGSRVAMSQDKTSVEFLPEPEIRPLVGMQIWSDGIPYSILLRRSKKVAHDFVFDPEGADHKEIQLTADFNGWTPSRTPLEREDDGRWMVRLHLNPGKYQYQLVIDGKWGLDPVNPDSVDNNVGGFNSVLTVEGPDPVKVPFLYTKETEGNVVEVGVMNAVEEYFIYWQNYRLNEDFIEPDEDGIEIDIPSGAGKMERSYIRIYAYNDNGLSNDLIVPLKYGQVLSSAGDLLRSDLQAMVMYNVFIDRFSNGDPSNDRPLNIPEVLPPADYQGGDLAGVIQKLDEGYFDSLGVNSLWISPVVLNPSGPYGQWPDPPTKFSAYHGYWPVSFTRMDDRLGTPEELKELVRKAHERGISIYLDFIAHHVHMEHPYYKQHPDRTTSLYLPDGSLNTEKWDEYRLTTWFDVFLPTLDLQNPEVTDMLSDSAVWWIKEYGLDGFRHDATKHVPEIFWRELTRKIKTQVMEPEGRIVYQIGETYGSPELISGYVGAGMLDAQFDFNVYDASIGVFGRDKDSFIRLDEILHQSFQYYGNHNLMGYITGNQDRARFISYAGGGLGWEENGKLAGWTRKVGVGDPVGYRKLSMLTAFDMTIPGIPVIYYGDEIGMPGGNDPDSRRMMRFDSLSDDERQTLATARKLGGIRKDHLSLVYGDFKTLLVTDKTFAYARNYFGDVTVVIFNKDTIHRELRIRWPGWLERTDLQANFGNAFGWEEETLIISLEPYTFEILTTE